MVHQTLERRENLKISISLNQMTNKNENGTIQNETIPTVNLTPAN